MKKRFCLVFALLLFIGILPVHAWEIPKSEVTMLFTHDVHDYLEPAQKKGDYDVLSHGGAARLATLIQENTADPMRTFYVDAGDFSMGTLFQAGYTTEAYELRNLGILGCSATTLGNHEFDYGAKGLADMLRAAKASGDTLPQIVQTNIDFSGNLTAEQQDLQKAMEEYGVKPYLIQYVSGYQIGIIGLNGPDSINCMQADVAWTDYIDSAKKTVKELTEMGCDAIVALSHSGTDGNGGDGEDIKLAKAVPDLDIIISGHSHSKYHTPVKVGETVILSAGEELENLGKLVFTCTGGVIRVVSYELLAVDENVEEKPETLKRIQKYKKEINKTFLKEYKAKFDDVIAHSSFDFQSMSEMTDSHKEFMLGDMIADSYLYAACQNGIDDIDVALVSQGTIRASLQEGDITVNNVFSVCSLGAGADGSMGHPLVVGYVTGKELKLLTELDASIGKKTTSVRLSYSGLSMTFNPKRLFLDRVTDVHLVRPDGSTEEIQNGKLYKVCCNLYDAKMLRSVSDQSKGVLKVVPKNADGSAIHNLYDVAMKDLNGNEVKEWVAFKDFLGSFEKGKSDVPEIPEQYKEPLGRKNYEPKGGLAAKFSHPGTACKVMFVVVPVVIVVGLAALVLLYIVLTKIKNFITAMLNKDEESEESEDGEQPKDEKEKKSKKDKKKEKDSEPKPE